MSKIQKSKFKLSRRIGASVHDHPNDAYKFKKYFPGQHGRNIHRAATEYGKQLIAKQAIKYHHNITEKQLRIYYKKSVLMKGDNTSNLVAFLNSRLDVNVFRAGFAPTFYAACQLVSHGHVLVNGRRVNIRSYQLKVDDVVSLSQKGLSMQTVQEAIAKAKASKNEVKYLSVDYNSNSFRFINVPTLSEVPYPFQAKPNLIVEFYSK
ncbi:MAG: hypothetical protein RL208_297 [Pseudomonadota bacterium]|jgi:small subunit ribosomal protein S4